MVIDSLPSGLNLDGDLSIELLGRGKDFFGLGTISQGGLALRSARRPMFVEIRNPGGTELLNYRMTHCEVSSEHVRISFSMDQQEEGLMEWMVHTVRPRYNTADWTLGPKPAGGHHSGTGTPARKENHRSTTVFWFFVSVSLSQRDDSYL